MSSSPKAPPAPDYTGAAQATAAGNLEAVKYQTEANRINQYTPFGNLTYSQNANGTWNQNTSLAPELAAALQSQLQMQQGRSDLANKMMGAVGGSYGFTGPNKAAIPNTYQANPGQPTAVAAPAGPVSYANGTTPPPAVNGALGGAGAGDIRTGTIRSQAAKQMLSPEEYSEEVNRLNRTKGFMNSLFGSNNNTWTRSSTGEQVSYDQELARLNAERDAYTAANAPAALAPAAAQPAAPVQYESQFSGEYKPFQAPQLSSYLAGVNGVNQGSVGQAGQFNATGKPLNTTYDRFSSSTPGLDTTYDRFSSSTPGLDTTAYKFDGANSGQDTRNLAAADYLRNVQGINQNAESYLGGVNGVNQNAPQFDPTQASQYQKAAYEAQMALMRPDLDRQQQSLQNSLALQGLNPGTEANTNAQTSFSMARAAQENALAASSYLSGSQTARDNFASQLSGFNAGNAAQNQAFGQSMNVFDANNAARNTVFNQGMATQQGDLAATAASNAARNTLFNQGATTFGLNLQGTQAANVARTQQLQNELSAFGANQGAATSENAARTQQLQNELSAFGANQGAATAENAARAADYAQQLQGYQANLQGLSTNAQLNAAQNAAQQQAYGQAVNNYGMDYQSALAQRNMPLNELNALQSGQQVQSPQFNSFALQGNAGGADLLGATQAKGQWDQGIYNQQAATAAGNNSAMAGLAGTAAMAFMMY